MFRHKWLLLSMWLHGILFSIILTGLHVDFYWSCTLLFYSRPFYALLLIWKPKKEAQERSFPGPKLKSADLHILLLIKVCWQCCTGHSKCLSWTSIHWWTAVLQGCQVCSDLCNTMEICVAKILHLLLQFLFVIPTCMYIEVADILTLHRKKKSAINYNIK